MQANVQVTHAAKGRAGKSGDQARREEDNEWKSHRMSHIRMKCRMPESFRGD